MFSWVVGGGKVDVKVEIEVEVEVEIARLRIDQRRKIILQPQWAEEYCPLIFDKLLCSGEKYLQTIQSRQIHSEKEHSIFTIVSDVYFTSHPEDAIYRSIRTQPGFCPAPVNAPPPNPSPS